MNRRRLLIAVYLIILFYSEGARAEESFQGLRFSWGRGPGAEECLSYEEMLAEVERRLGRNPLSPTATRSIEGFVVREANGWRAFISHREGDRVLGERVLESDEPTCQSLGDAAALTITLAIDPEALTRARPENDPNEGQSGGHGSPEGQGGGRGPGVIGQGPEITNENDLNCQEQCEDDPQPEALRGGFTFRAVGQYGLLPGVSPGVAIASDMLAVWRLRWSVGVVFFPEVGVPNEAPDFTFGLVAASIGLCIDFVSRPSISFSGCGTWLAGAVHAVTFTYDPESPGDRFWTGAGAGLRVVYNPIGPFVIELGADAQFPIIRHQFRVRGEDGVIFQQSVAAAVFFIGLGIYFL